MSSDRKALDVLKEITDIFEHDLKACPRKLAYRNQLIIARALSEAKADALDEAADAIDRDGADYPQGFLRGRAAKIRQQAEAEQ